MSNTATYDQASQVTLSEKERKNRRLVRYWLYLICLMVFAMVLVGGATRLTDSGLSITEWKPIHGIIPPLSAQDWSEEFEKYKLIPEYSQVNAGMSISEFKTIYWWEWSHRFLGRVIGFVFFIPMVLFWLTGKLESRIKPKLVALLALGGLQGFIGWWMVSSGLVDRVDVSQYRLALHLNLAAMIFAYAMWVARGLAPHREGAGPSRIAFWGVMILIMALIQIFLGALVAGLHAGMAYNDWPKMGGQWLPDGLDAMAPTWVNWFENAKSVQFNHRIGGYILTILTIINVVVAFGGASQNTHRARTIVLMLLVLVQACIGIMTLVMQVPVSWALVHQGGAMVVLGFAVAHLRALKGEYAAPL